LILPVVICLSQRLSHARVSLGPRRGSSRGQLNNPAIISSTASVQWISAGILRLNHTHLTIQSAATHQHFPFGEHADGRDGRLYCPTSRTSFCPIISSVGYGPTEGTTGDGKSGFDSGEGA